MASSYDKIGNTFTKTSEWKQLNDDFRAALEKAGIDEFSCRTQNDYESGGYRVVVELIMKFNLLSLESVEYNATSYENFEGIRFPVESFVQDNSLNEFADKFFGTKGHPTYFCKREKLHKKWPDFARAKLVADNKDLVTEYVARVQEQRTAMLASPELESAKKRCYELAVIEDIRKVVQKFYRSVGPEVLKEALDGVVMHDIMES